MQMRIAVISDVHGNYPALVKVMEDARSNQVEQFVFAGDYVFDLPFSNEVTELLMSLDNASIVKGNKEVYLISLRNENKADWVYNQMGAVYQTYRELKPEAFDFLANLKDELYIPLNDGMRLYAVHYFKDLKPVPKTNCSSSNYHKKMLKEPFTHDEFLIEFSELINSREYKLFIDKIDAKVIVFGHNHLQAYGYCGDKLIINPGSCGQPLDFNTDAAYSILEINQNGFNVIERRVPYDIEAIVDEAKSSLVYQHGTIWCELVFLALRTGQDYFGIFFEIAYKIAASKNENGAYYSNPTWQKAYEFFKEKYLF